MKKIIFLAAAFSVSSSFAMVRAGVNIGPEPGYYDGGVYYHNGYYSRWYGPGWYYGVYHSDYPSYHAWQRRYYYGGPYYYRGRHHHHGY